MKKIFFLLFLIFTCTIVKAQFYIQPQVGYAFSRNPTTIETTLIKYAPETTLESNLALGQGISANIIIGYKFSEKYFTEFAFNKQFKDESNFTIDQDYHDATTVNSFRGPMGKATYNSKSNYLSVQFGYAIRKDKLRVKFKLGPNLLFSKFSYTNTYTERAIPVFMQSERLKTYSIDVKNKVDWGVVASLSFDYFLSRNFYLNMEAIANFNKTTAESKYESIPISESSIWDEQGYHIINTDPVPNPYDVLENSDFSRIGLYLGLGFML